MRLYEFSLVLPSSPGSDKLEPTRRLAVLPNVSLPDVDLPKNKFFVRGGSLTEDHFRPGRAGQNKAPRGGTKAVTCCGERREEKRWCAALPADNK